MHCSTTDNEKKPITALETNQSLQSSMLHKITLKKVILIIWYPAGIGNIVLYGVVDYIVRQMIKLVLPNISMNILLTVLYTLSGANMENLFNNQELLYFLIISYILLTLMFDSGVIL